MVAPFFLCTVNKYKFNLLFGVPVPTAWRVLGLRMQEWPRVWGLAVNILNKQSWPDNKGWRSSLGWAWG
jgi:hypothetical protein